MTQVDSFSTVKLAGNSSSQSSEARDDRICDENVQSKRQCRKFIASTVGTGPQPVLETLKYQVSNCMMCCHFRMYNSVFHQILACFYRFL